MKKNNIINKSYLIKKSNSFATNKRENNYNLNLTFTELPKNKYQIKFF